MQLFTLQIDTECIKYMGEIYVIILQKNMFKNFECIILKGGYFEEIFRKIWAILHFYCLIGSFDAFNKKLQRPSSFVKLLACS